MARIRTVKPEFWTDEKIVDLDPWERLLFIGLWNFADDQGFIDLSVKRIKMQIFPGDTYDVSVGLQRLSRAHLIEVYESPRGHVLHIANWAKHQKISNAAKPKYSSSDLRKVESWPESSGGLARSLDSYPAEGKGKEGKGEVPLEHRTDLTVPSDPAPVDNPAPSPPPVPVAATASRRVRDHEQIDRRALRARIEGARNDRAAQIQIASQIVTIWTDATEDEAVRLADWIRLDRQPTNVAAVTLAIADAGDLPEMLRRVRAEQPYRHPATGALAGISRAPADIGKPPDLAAVRAQLAAASQAHLAGAKARADPLAELRAATEPTAAPEE